MTKPVCTDGACVLNKTFDSVDRVSFCVEHNGRWGYLGTSRRCCMMPAPEGAPVRVRLSSGCYAELKYKTEGSVSSGGWKWIAPSASTVTSLDSTVSRPSTPNHSTK